MKNCFKSLKLNIGALLTLLCISSTAQIAQADTITNYMTIATNIPVMAMKPDEQSQSWVRSAQRMLSLTDETMAQTIVAMNTVAAKQSHPVFCFPQGILFDANTVHDIIQKTYTELVKTQGNTIGNMSISDVLMLGMVSRYGCSPTPATVDMGVPASSAQLPAPVAGVQASAPAPAASDFAAPSSSALQMPVPSTPAAPGALPPPMPQPQAPAPQPQTAASQTSLSMPTDSMANNPYGTPPTQQTVTAENPPAL